jgi:single-strand DNA-binding protein
MNLVILQGNLGQDPEVRTTPNGTQVATFSVATSKKWKDQQGQQQEKTEWHRVVVWSNLAQVCAQYLKKGSKVLVKGEINYKQWQDPQGQTKYSTEIRADEVKFLSPIEHAGQPVSPPLYQPSQPQNTQYPPSQPKNTQYPPSQNSAVVPNRQTVELQPSLPFSDQDIPF